MTTHVLCIIDESGSMDPHRTDTIGGFNSFIDDLAADTEQQYEVTVVLFSSRQRYRVHAKALPPGDPKLRLDVGSYRPGGFTALLDATGRAINDHVAHIGSIVAAGQPRPDQVICLSITDGEENHSVEYTFPIIKSLIEVLRQSGIWDFRYLAQGLDGWRQAGAMGYTAADYVGTQVVTSESSLATYNTVSDVTRARARGKHVDSATGMSRHLPADQIREAPDNNQ